LSNYDLYHVVCVIKFIAKALANRLQSVVGELVSHNQSAFFEARLISLPHGHIRDFNKPMGSMACIKIDLQKVFDTVNREFVLYIMHCMGFSPVWNNWIKECLQSPFPVPVNGSYSGCFNSNRGINRVIRYHLIFL